MNGVYVFCWETLARNIKVFCFFFSSLLVFGVLPSKVFLEMFQTRRNLNFLDYSVVW